MEKVEVDRTESNKKGKQTTKYKHLIISDHKYEV